MVWLNIEPPTKEEGIRVKEVVVADRVSEGNGRWIWDWHPVKWRAVIDLRDNCCGNFGGTWRTQEEAGKRSNQTGMRMSQLGTT